MTVDEVKRRYLRVRAVPDTSLRQVRMGVPGGWSVGLTLHTHQQAAYDDMDDVARVVAGIINDAIDAGAADSGSISVTRKGRYCAGHSLLRPRNPTPESEARDTK